MRRRAHGGAPPTVTWPSPAPIPYGVPLSSAQLNATASVNGTFAYTPGEGYVLPVGTHTLWVTFTPAGGHMVQSAVSITVSKATPNHRVADSCRDSLRRTRSAKPATQCQGIGSGNFRLLSCRLGEVLGAGNTHDLGHLYPHRRLRIILSAHATVCGHCRKSDAGHNMAAA